MVKDLWLVVGLEYDEQFWSFSCACIYSTGCGGRGASGPSLYGSGQGRPVFKTDPCGYTLRFSDDTAKASIMTGRSRLVPRMIITSNMNMGRCGWNDAFCEHSPFSLSIAALVQSLSGFASK